MTPEQSTSVWCFQCGSEYAPTVAVCVECGVGLVDTPPLAPEQVGAPDEEQLAYEFHDWSFESRRMLDQLLTARGIAHSWQGASMIVRSADEEAVDALVDEVEVATLPTLDPDAEHTVYEMAGWTGEQQTELSRRLGFEGIPHEFDANGDMVINAEDEARVDEVLDELESWVGHAAEEGEDGEPVDSIELDGLDVNDLLSTLYGAADRLRRNARDANGVLEFLDNAPVIERLRTPFGFDRPVWVAVVESTRALRGALEDDESDDEEVRQRAQEVRDRLFTLI